MSTKHFGKRSAKLLLFVVVGLLLLPSSLILAKDVNMELLFTKTEAVSIMEERAKKKTDVQPNV